MNKIILLIFIILISKSPAIAHHQQFDTTVVTRQCSAIRELVYAAWHNHFEPFKEEETRNSNGYIPGGAWIFSTVRYRSSLSWPGASISYLEHYQETIDSTRTDRWQYIAEYSNIATLLDAERMYRQLNNEISGCPYPLSDTLDVTFQPLSPELLPKERPSSLETASMYELPLPGSDAKKSTPPVMVMVGMEKLRNGYRVSLIIDNTSTTRR